MFQEFVQGAQSGLICIYSRTQVMNLILQLLSNRESMGSRITRALSVTDRQRRIHPQSQAQAKQFIRLMCSSMYGLLAFGMGFLTEHSNQSPQKCYQYLVIAVISAFVVNISNQQLCFVVGWFMLGIQTLFLSDHFKLMYTTGTFLVLMAVFINLFNYYGGVSQNASQSHSFTKNIKPSVLIMIGSCFLTCGHCSGHFAKLLRAQANNGKMEEPHNIGLKFVFVFLGLMIVALTFLGHVYIRNRRFVPMGPSQQINHLKSLKITNAIQITLIMLGLRAFMMGIPAQQCTSGPFLAFLLVFTIALCFCVHKLLTHILHKSIPPNIPTLITLTILLLCTISHMVSLTFYVTYPLTVVLCMLLINTAANLMDNLVRVSYLVVFIVAIVLQSYSKRHAYKPNAAKQVVDIDNKHQVFDVLVDLFSTVWMAAICATIGILLGQFVEFVKNKAKYKEIKEPGADMFQNRQ